MSETEVNVDQSAEKWEMDYYTAWSKKNEASSHFLLLSLKRLNQLW